MLVFMIEVVKSVIECIVHVRQIVIKGLIAMYVDKCSHDDSDTSDDGFLLSSSEEVEDANIDDIGYAKNIMKKKGHFDASDYLLDHQQKSKKGNLHDRVTTIRNEKEVDDKALQDIYQFDSEYAKKQLPFLRQNAIDNADQKKKGNFSIKDSFYKVIFSMFMSSVLASNSVSAGSLMNLDVSPMQKDSQKNSVNVRSRSKVFK